MRDCTILNVVWFAGAGSGDRVCVYGVVGPLRKRNAPHRSSPAKVRLALKALRANHLTKVAGKGSK
jgi:hypothetical protein